MQPELQALKGGRAGAHETVVRRVSRRHDDEGHGGAWKVAFADFCLALLCLFLVLWLLATRNAERLQVVLEQSSGNLQGEAQHLNDSLSSGTRGSLIERHPVPARSNDPSAGDPTRGGSEVRGRRPSLDSPEKLLEMAHRISGLAAEVGLQGHVRTAVTPQGLRLQLHDTEAAGMFERGSAAPGVRLKALLNRLGPLLAEVRNQVLIVGHTDATPYQDRAPGAFTNWALSSHRAMAARLELMAGGMPESSVLQVVGMADAAPLDPQNPTAATNRRIELMLLTSAQSRAIAGMYGPLGQIQVAAEEQIKAATR